jgi:short subunit fatty acids transporter
MFHYPAKMGMVLFFPGFVRYYTGFMLFFVPVSGTEEFIAEADSTAAAIIEKLQPER